MLPGVWVGLCGAVLAAAPPFVTDGSLEPQAEVRREAGAAWARLEAVYAQATGESAGGRRDEIRFRRGTRLSPARNGESRPGVVELRQAKDFELDERLRTALRHELAHQFLWDACPAASEDGLFHEAFAVATSGELAAWTEGEYLSLSRAAQVLREPRRVEGPEGRKALARLLAESSRDGELPLPLRRRLEQCRSGGRWTAMGVAELSGDEVVPRGHAFVVVSRHSGEVLVSEGDARTPLPFGSTLKPFVLAGATATPPVLPPRHGQPEWECGKDLPARVDATTALLRSCNGYFLDWAAREPVVARFGAYGPALEALGLARLPEGMPEAIGLRATLALSPLALAQAYRLLAEARPDLIAAMKENVAKGTLSELPDSAALAGVATKTGTVRDAESHPRLGWIVAVDEDRVAVMVRTGKMPRSFLGEFRAALEKARALPGQGPARVQVLGLLDPGDVEARCDGAGFAAGSAGPRPAGREFRKLKEIVSRGPAVCLGAPWRVRFPGLPSGGREYAGVFSLSIPPPYRPPPGLPVTERAIKARRGSDYVFRTTLLQYTSGVLAAEDGSLTGEARAALARVVAHNAMHSRHPGRPVCDTTHCQAFQGTVRVRAEDAATLAKPPLPSKEWLLFSQGGDEPWSERRTRAQVEAVLGRGAAALRFEGGKVQFVRTETEGASTFESPESWPCELLRNPLKLPACPRSARGEGEMVVFEGKGRGHGEGLDVEQAKQATGTQDELLRRAYGFGPAR